jgi:AraC-like DNA-binding protein/quercetin dioxygenase-like cupin family protein
LRIYFLLTFGAGFTRPQIVQVFREYKVMSGFLYEKPVKELPGVTHCGEAICYRGHSLAPHSHEGFEFHYLSRGTAHWQAAGHAYCQRMGEVFINHPHELHSTGRKANPENQYIWLGVSLDKFGSGGKRLARQIRRTDARIVTDCQEAELILRAIIGQVVTMRRQRAQVVQALIDAFIALVEQQLACAPDPTYRTFRAIPYSPAVRKALAYMKRSLDHRVPLRVLAGAATMRSAPHFCSQFHREVGVTPAAYHMSLRLEAAREMLRQPAFDITTTALQSGFNSSQHFSTLFKRTFGVTPRIWKNKINAIDKAKNSDTRQAAPNNATETSRFAHHESVISMELAR